MADQPIKKSAQTGNIGFTSLIGGAKVAGAINAEVALRHTTAAEDLVVAELAEPSEIGFWRLALIRFLHHRTATISLVILAIIIAAAVIVPVLQGNLYRVQDYTHPYGAPFLFHSKAVSVAGLSF